VLRYELAPARRAQTAIRPGNSHEWEAIIIRRRSRPYQIRIHLRAHIPGDASRLDEVQVHLDSTCHALALNGARRKAQRIVEQCNSRDGLDVPIPRTAEVRLETPSSRSQTGWYAAPNFKTSNDDTVERNW
jgi:hypothetical protein